MPDTASHPLVAMAQRAPDLPGVYLFKDETGQVLYVGKAKSLKRRLAQYVQGRGKELKADAIFDHCTQLDWRLTDTELAAMLLEASLICQLQPRFNVLLKSGQPFVYIFIPSGRGKKLPELQVVRNQKAKGTYFGPFLEKGSARKAVEFLLNTFRLRLCNKKIENGCLYYHMGLCAGACRADFDATAYLERLALAKTSLAKGHAAFLAYLDQEIAAASAALAFERARELHGYRQAFAKVFEALRVTRDAPEQYQGMRDVWVFCRQRSLLFVYKELRGSLTVRQFFYVPGQEPQELEQACLEYFESFYRTHQPCSMVLVDFALSAEACRLYGQFLQEWHRLEAPPVVLHTVSGSLADVLRLARVHADQEASKRASLAKTLKQFLRLQREPRVIDCVDISHKQGHAMVGSCVRFVDGKPDVGGFRHMHIRDVVGQNDYASLQEVVQRRYQTPEDYPDLLMIDGGKGQLHAVAPLVPGLACISIAKREEIIFADWLPGEGKKLDQKSFVGHVLIALRDYAHHAAVSFHQRTELRKNFLKR